ncbi:hypothetical protein [Bartonella bacilliformis]|uniref:hypothetical protein n=1 Tax=Bartonella bacilliformis TaxID=774 RepID=UPI0004A0DC90|nr:hypothetical protein [Bartonella bacilliformis]KEG23608.1 hypothetical protein H703_00189 [Bartonella bacilliformis Ver075]
MGGFWTMMFLFSILSGLGLLSKKSKDGEAPESGTEEVSSEVVAAADALSTTEAVSTTVEVLSTFV